MKLSTLLFACTLFPALPAFADDPSSGTLVAIPVDASFVPVGFDDNDDVMVVLDGNLPNNCYKVSHTAVIREPSANKVHVIQYARRYPGICLQNLVPFFSETNLGVMPIGTFGISTLGATPETLSVTEATSAGPDEFLYAPVDHAKIVVDDQNNAVSGILEGRFTNSCMKIKEVTVINSGKTIEVLPKMEMVASPDGCNSVEIPFSWTIELPKGLAKGRHLLHVRSLNGKAVNRMFSVY